MNNPYITHIIEQTGMSEREVVTSMMPSLQKRTYPCVIQGRTFWSEDDYLNQMYEFLNGL